VAGANCLGGDKLQPAFHDSRDEKQTGRPITAIVNETDLIVSVNNQALVLVDLLQVHSQRNCVKTDDLAAKLERYYVVEMKFALSRTNQQFTVIRYQRDVSDPLKGKQCNLQ